MDEPLDGDGFFHTDDGGYLDGEGRLFLASSRHADVQAANRDPDTLKAR